MTSKKKKGQSKELLAKKILIAEGWLVGFKSQTIRMGPFFKANDMFGLFDLVCVRTRPIEGFGKDAKCPEWLFVSVKHYKSGDKAETRTKIDEFCAKYRFAGLRAEQWVWKRGYFGRGKNRVYVKGEFERNVIV